MRAHIFQHVPFEGLGNISDWLTAADANVSSTRFFEDPTLPRLHDIDLLIVMGGPMSVNDEAVYPWLKAEKQFVREAIDAGKAVLGVCLGAQLIAAALGSRIYPNEEKEIGWFPIRRSVAPDSQEAFRFPEEVTVFHWHGETFDLPPGAIRLASSQACQNQAFQIGRRVIGLQLHLEVTPQSVDNLASNCRNELIDSRYIQTEDQILAASPEIYQTINSLMFTLLDYLVQD